MLNVMQTVRKEGERVDVLEKLLGKGLWQPFNNLNSSSRKVMLSAQLEQILPLFNTEVPLIQTGYEDLFGEMNNTFLRATQNHSIINKIPRYTTLPNGDYIPGYRYILIIRNNETGIYSFVERVFGQHTTETYGFLYNNSYIDNLQVGSIINPGDVIKKSISYSDYNNRQDGINLRSCYMGLHDTTEDGIVVSASAAEKLKSPLFKKVLVVINDNDIPLNLYGDGNIFKSFPDVTENIHNGILCGVRRESKDKAFYALSWDRLMEIMTSDEKYPLNGKVIDIDVRCNNPQKLEESAYYTQIDGYYKDSIRFSKDIVNSLYQLVEHTPDQCSYELIDLYKHHRDVVYGKKFMGDNNKPFSNVMLEFTIMDVYPLDKGDKLSDRYGGKGVVSKVMPDELMPRDLDGKPIEMIFNSIGPVGRENPGQLVEVSLTSISRHILELLRNSSCIQEALELYYRFIDLIVPQLSQEVKMVLNGRSEAEVYRFIDTLQEGIILSIDPVSQSIDIDGLNRLYQEFPDSMSKRIKVPIVSSSGEIRYVDSRRPVTVGDKYIYRLQQYSEDKFSATSLSTTSLKNQPAKSRASKFYKSPYPKTPVSFGDMETGNMMHIQDTFSVVENLMIHSTSPKGRRKAEELLKGNPFDVDLRIEKEDINRNVEVLNTYLKTIGVRLVFKRVKKQKRSPVKIRPVVVRNSCFDDYEYEFYTKPIKVKKKGETYKFRPVSINYDKKRPCKITPVRVTIKPEDE